MAKANNGVFRLRIEDIDTARCRPEFETAIYDDLRWLGLSWPEPVLRQSERTDAYLSALQQLTELGLTYPCSCTRADIRAALSAPQEGVTGPDGPLYPGTCRHRPMSDHNSGDAIRLNMARAAKHLKSLKTLQDTVGDIVLARRDIGTSYHLAVVVDDAYEGITHVVRGMDLQTATPIHVLLQSLLNLPHLTYHHHRLIRDEAGKRLAKRDDARALATLRAEGATPQSIRGMLDL